MSHVILGLPMNLFSLDMLNLDMNGKTIKTSISMSDMG